jgi:4-diphosphocytidyl-2-C-methyl-D-erythritol kinase
MLFFPNCKINLGLKVIRRRPDGYHDLETIFYPLPLKDALEIMRLAREPGVHGSTHEPRFTSYGLPIPGAPENNLCLKAWALLKKDYPDLPTVHIHLLKIIPIGAGLGGGSADGAWTLRALNTQFHLNLTTAQLLQYAALLGSDCPFFILNTPCLGGGRGEQLQPIDLDLSPYTFALVDPGIHVSTAKAFEGCTPAENPTPLTTIVAQPIATWRDQLQNDFEPALFHLYPELAKIPKTLYAHGALYASLTGSGSSFFAIFPKDKAPAQISFSFSSNYRILP